MISFREMKSEDADRVAAIEAASFPVPWSRQSFWEEASNEQAYYLLAISDGEIIGYAGAWLVLDEAQVTNIAVAPAWRGRGVGRLLLTELIARVKVQGAVRMTLEVRPSNTAALALYDALGFQDCGRRPGYYQDNDEDAVIMWKMKL